MNRRLIAASAALLALACGWGQAAEEASFGVKGPKGELTVDAKGISLAPSIVSCPAISAQSEPLWAVLLQKDGQPPIQGNPVALTDRGQCVRRESTPGGGRLIYESLSDGTRTWRIGLTLNIRTRATRSK